MPCCRWRAGSKSWTQAIAALRATPRSHAVAMLLVENTLHRTVTSQAFVPLSGAALLTQLRGSTTLRTHTDLGLAGGLRSWLEDACYELLPDDAPPLTINKTSVVRSHLPIQREGVPTFEFLRGVLVSSAFRLHLQLGASKTPFLDAMDALESDARQVELVAAIRALSPGDLADLQRDVHLHAKNLADRWPTLHPSWLPRTGIAMSVPLAGGRVLLRGWADLLIGAPRQEVASVCLVSIRSTPLHPLHREELHFAALIETLRSGIPPFRVASYSTLTGEIDAEPVTEDLLKGAVHTTIGALRDLRGLNK